MVFMNYNLNDVLDEWTLLRVTKQDFDTISKSPCYLRAWPLHCHCIATAAKVPDVLSLASSRGYMGRLMVTMGSSSAWFGLRLQLSKTDRLVVTYMGTRHTQQWRKILYTLLLCLSRGMCAKIGFYSPIIAIFIYTNKSIQKHFPQSPPPVPCLQCPPDWPQTRDDGDPFSHNNRDPRQTQTRQQIRELYHPTRFRQHETIPCR